MKTACAVLAAFAEFTLSVALLGTLAAGFVVAVGLVWSALVYLGRWLWG